MSEATEKTLSEGEVKYIKKSPIARIATVSPSGFPDNVPIFCIYRRRNNKFYFGGMDLEATLKYKNLQSNQNVAIVFDDVEWQPQYRPRGIKVKGIAELISSTKEENMDGRIGVPIVRVTPRKVLSWGIESDPFGENGGFLLKQGETTTEIKAVEGAQ